MRRVYLLFLSIFLIVQVSALCEEGQIDINTASINELDKLYGVGETIAQYIIDARPYDSVDDLIDAYRIGEITLEKIKEQGLACVANEESNQNSESEVEDVEEIQDIENETNDEKNSNKNFEIKNNEILSDKEESNQNKITAEVIKLNPKSIKNEESKENSGNSYALYGFLGFCVLFAVFLIYKKRDYKNEFE